MKKIVIFLFCMSFFAGCSHPRHETLVYYVPVPVDSSQMPVTGDAGKAAVQPSAQAAAQPGTQATAEASQTPVPAPQPPVNITTLYPAPLPYTGTVTTYYVPAPRVHLFFGPSFGYFHHRPHSYFPHRGFYPHRGFSHRRWR